MMKKRILLTGSNGFIGRNIQESFLARKYDLCCPRHAELDLADTQAVDRFFASQSFDVVLHAAVKPGHRNAPDSHNLLATNLRMFENLARNADHFGKCLNFGSGAVYDAAADNREVSEDALYARMGTDEHSFCKYLISKRIDSLDNFINLTIFGIFGPHEDWQIRFISNAVCKALFGLPITLRQDRCFSYLYAPDLMPILEFFIENKVQYKSYNIVPDQSKQLLDVAQLVRQISGGETKVVVSKEGEGVAYSGSNVRLRREFAAVRFTPMEQAVQQLYAWYTKNQSAINKQALLSDK